MFYLLNGDYNPKSPPKTVHCEQTPLTEALGLTFRANVNGFHMHRISFCSLCRIGGCELVSRGIR